MMRRDSLIIVAILAIAGCTETFEPNVNGPRPFAVFAVLNTASDSQTVRLTGTSDPTEPHPTIRPVAGAVVAFEGAEGTFVCQPVLRMGDLGTADSVITEYVASAFRPLRGNTYTLRVQTSSRTAVSTIIVPAPYASPIYLRDFVILQSPHSYPLNTLITASATLAPQTLGMMIRFMLEYEVFRDSVWTIERLEVPLAYPTGPNMTAPVYPTLTRRENKAPLGGGSALPEVTFFSNRAYEETITRLHDQIGSSNLRMRKAVFYLVQADRHFFTYYAFANSFADPLSIRVDQPDYSNISGALGVFGAMTLDSVSYSIPPLLGPRLL